MEQKRGKESQKLEDMLEQLSILLMLQPMCLQMSQGTN
jgi:hypothetical protein